ncbi:DENN domain-containing protein [Cyphellophora attinorum]|uniref:DENN domain-containing protein n=1 Tax=Cyphellophora attinorum TaxID=1664694 RepID=A0A0N1H8J9_9EURO|nr:DENN domain-containing protein [Phialophora attinorum]KPI43284.1 DENN domain-containing protein [Phialophora attinorum]
MAPAEKSRAIDTSNPPLADYFWIAGVDSQQLLDAYKPHRWSYEGPEALGVGSDLSAEAPIQEDVVAELAATSSPLQSPRTNGHGHKRKDSYQRLSDLSGEARSSIQSLENGTTHSRSSSMTIKAATTSITNGGGNSDKRMSTVISDLDFENAMQKFTNDRESFFLDLNFSNNATTNKAKSRASRSRPRTQKIVSQDVEPVPNGLSRHLGSVRRHLSVKDLSSSKRQPSMAHRMSTRTTKRISSYNSVVPSPEALRSSPEQHPLRRKFEPVLLDRYPRSSMADEMSKRDRMPEYLPMFAFPNDISIVSSDSRPHSTWHEFSMTAGDNTKIPAVCIIVYIPLKRETADELEQRCEEWRRANMTEAEREMAASLAERLALERAKLSQLLARLPSVEGDARQDLEDEIGTVEERIAVMADMLRPLRHGAASRIDGLTDDDSTGLWIPRAYGVLGKDPCMSSFLRQWLRAVAVPMHDGSILRVPASSPRIGMWQPLEQYVHVLCSLAARPTTSKTQLDLKIRELHLYAKKEAHNELPGARTTDLWPLFRALTIPNIIVLLEYVLSESRIILISSHTSMLQLVSRAMLELIWPFKWAGVYIPVLPSRLVQALEAPCPYICGIDRSYEKWELPEDDFVLVDLDKNELQSTAHPPALPKQIRRKLMALLHLAAPHHHSFGVTPGPPVYAIETYPYNSFAADHPSVFTGIAQSTNLSKLVSLSSTMFGPQAAADTIRRAPILNAFLANGPTRAKSTERPRTASTASRQPPSHPDSTSPVTSNFPPAPLTPTSRNDSGYALQTSLREKRSGHFDSHSKRNPSMSGLSTQFSSMGMRRRGSQPFNGSTASPTSRHNASPSTTSISPADYYPSPYQQQIPPTSTYAPSTYAQSTLAASTIMPHLHVQPPPVSNSATTQWIEGHMLLRRPATEGMSTCVLCDERPSLALSFVVKAAALLCMLRQDRVAVASAARLRSPFPALPPSTQIRKYLVPIANASINGSGTGSASSRRQVSQQPPALKGSSSLVAKFDLPAFTRSLERDHGEYITMLGSTQGFMEFVGEREVSKDTLSEDDRVRIQLFDAIILAKAKRGGKARWGMSRGPSLGSGLMSSASSGARGVFGSRSVSSSATNGAGYDSGGNGADLLNDTSTHQWRPVAAPGSSSDKPDISPQAAKGREYRQIISRVPATLEEALFPGSATTSSRKSVGSSNRVPSLPKLPDPSKWSVKHGEGEQPTTINTVRNSFASTVATDRGQADPDEQVPPVPVVPAESSSSATGTWGKSGPPRISASPATTEAVSTAKEKDNHKRGKSSATTASTNTTKMAAAAAAAAATSLRSPTSTTAPAGEMRTPKKKSSGMRKPAPLQPTTGAAAKERAVSGYGSSNPPRSPAAERGMNGLGMHSPVVDRFE